MYCNFHSVSGVKPKKQPMHDQLPFYSICPANALRFNIKTSL